jgi:hypothetical protein
MANGLDHKNSLLVGVLIGAVVVALGVLAYFYYQRSQGPTVKVDVPGFSGEIRKENGGVDIEVGKPKPSP